ncbi:hypothetical protein BCEP27_31023 [Burkholderia cepacia]
MACGGVCSVASHPVAHAGISVASRCSGPELSGDRRDAHAMAACRLEVARRHFFGQRIGRRLRHRPDIGAHAIQVVTHRGFHVRRLDVHADPDAAVLPGQQEEVFERVELVAVDAGAVGEAAKDLVPPSAFEPDLRGCVGKLLELPARAAHVGRRAEQDRVRAGERFPGIRRNVSLAVDRDEHGAGAFGDSACHALGMPVAGVEYDDCVDRSGVWCHGCFLSFGLSAVDNMESHSTEPQLSYKR